MTHIGVASDIFSGFIRARTPILHHFSLTAKYGASLANNLVRKVYGGGAQFYFTPEHAMGLEYTRQYAYFQEEVVETKGGRVTFHGLEDRQTWHVAD